jgi:hypothetical protein
MEDVLGIVDPDEVGEQSPGVSPQERLLKRLLTSLIEGTQSGVIAWEVDEAHRDSYCVVGEGWLVATRSVDGDGQAPYVVVVTATSGEPAVEVKSTSAFGRPMGNLFARLHAGAAATASMSSASTLLASAIAELERPGAAIGAADRPS